MHDDSDAAAVDEGAPGADAGESARAPDADAGKSAGAELPMAEDNKDSNRLRIKRTRSSGADGRDAASGSGDLPPAVPPAVPHPSTAAPKRRSFGRLLHAHPSRAGYVFSLLE